MGLWTMMMLVCGCVGAAHGASSYPMSECTWSCVVEDEAVEVYDTVCQGMPYEGEGFALTAEETMTAGDLTRTMTVATDDGEAMVTLYLHVRPRYAVTVDTTVCMGAAVPLGNHYWGVPGVYTDTLTTVGGCDSVVTLTLRLFAPRDTDVFDTVCANTPYGYFDTTFLSSGDYSRTYRSSVGCDSSVTLHLSYYDAAPIRVTGDDVGLGTDVLLMCDEDTSYLFVATLSGEEEEVLDRYRYTWSTGDTTRGIAVYEAGNYWVEATDSMGCTTRVAMVVTTPVPPIVNFNLSPTGYCAGGSYQLRVGYRQGMEIRLGRGRSTLSLAERIFLPDGVSCPPLGCSYRSPLTFTDFDTSARVRDVNDIRYIRLNMEHSFIGDLYMNITCPTGQQADLLRFGGSPTSDCASQIDATHRGWQSGSNIDLGTYMGLALDGEDYGYPCDSLRFDNQPGMGWNYCWSDNTDQGYGYATGDGLIYRYGNVQGFSVDSSNVAAHTHFYHPDDSFSNLVGCPLNGTWYIEVIDGWGGDNGYVFGWELALNPDLLPNLTAVAVMDSSSVGGPWVTQVDDSTFTLTPPAGLTHDTVVDYSLTIFDSNGCHYDTTFSVEYHVPTYTDVFDTVCVGGHIDFCGSTYSMPGTYTHTLSNVYGCDSVVTLHLENYQVYDTSIYDTVCHNEGYAFFGATYTTPGVYTHTATTQHGCDSIVRLHLSHHPVVVPNIEGGNVLCHDTTMILTATMPAGFENFPLTYLWNTGDTTPSITIASAGTYSVTVANSFGCIDTVTNVVTTPVPPIVSFNLSPTGYCAGGSYQLRVGYGQGVEIRLGRGNSSLSLAERIFLPDGVSCPPLGCSYRSPLTFTDFDTSARVRDVNDIRYIRLNMEHSFIGDLYMNITCPTGQQADLLRFGGSPTSDCASQIDATHRGWQPGSNINLGTYMGLALDDEDNGYPCDSLRFNNQPGYGWNYCWSDNTDQGYGYATGDGLIYRSGNSLGGSVDSSNVAAHTHFYHPDDSFSNLVGCPLNGTWYIEVIDGWGGDNGYVFGWELALNPDLLPNMTTIAVMDSSGVGGPWVTQVDDSTFTLTPPAGLTADTVVSYLLTIFDSNGCHYDTTFSIEYHAPVFTDVYDTVCEGGRIDFCGSSYSTPGVYAHTLSNMYGCDSVVTLHLENYPVRDTDLYDTVCPNGTYTFFETTCATPGTYTHTATTHYGCDSIVRLHLANYIIVPPVIEGGDLLCIDSSTLLTISSSVVSDRSPYVAYLWNTGDETQSITATEPGDYWAVAIDNHGCADTATMVLRTPVPPIISYNIDNYCAGGSYQLHVGYRDGLEVHLGRGTSTQSLAERIFLPDGIDCPPHGCSYRSSLSFTDFDTNARVRNVNDIRYVRLNIEHSYSGDLYVNITCPTGQQADLLRFGGTPNSSCAASIDATHRGWQNGTNAVSSTHFGIAYDYEDTYSPCDSLRFDNQPGIGWNYCWSNNNDQGYTYASGDGLIYRSANAHNGSFDSSNVAAHSQFYHPDDSFANLVGCPLNGDWYIEVMDGWSVDNGYAFGWELALNPDLLPSLTTIAVMESSNVGGPWVTQVDDSTFTLTPPAGLTHDTVVEYHLTIIDEEGCRYYDTFAVTFHAVNSDTVYEQVLQNELPHLFAGQSFNLPPNAPHCTVPTIDTIHSLITLSNRWGCDSVIDYHLNIIRNTYDTIDTVLCDNHLPLYWLGSQLLYSGSYTDTIPNSMGADSIVTLNLIVHPSYHSIQYDTIFYGTPYTFDGEVCDSSGIYLHRRLTAFGCDSISELQLRVNPTTWVDSSVCSNHLPLNWNGIDFYTSTTDSAVLRHTTVHSSEYDSLVVMTVHVLDTSSTDTFAVACNYFVWYNTTYSASTFGDGRQPAHLFSNLAGCDSVVHLFLEIRHTLYDTLTDSFCVGGHYHFGSYDITAPGSYNDTLPSVGGCDSILTMVLHQLPYLSFSLQEDHTCQLPIGYEITAVPGDWCTNGSWPGTVFLSWISDPYDVATLTADSVLRVNPEVTTQYCLTTDYGATPLCPYTDSITLTPIEPVRAIIDAQPAYLTYDNLDLRAWNRSTGYSWHHWWVNLMPYDDTNSNRLFFTSDRDHDSVVIMLRVGNDLCVDSTEVHIPLRRFSLYFPNVFTPDLTTNNRFYAMGTGIEEFEIWIFSRWGNLVYHSTDINEGWDGSHEGRPCPEAAYAYKCRYRSQLVDGYQTATGTVTILR